MTDPDLLPVPVPPPGAPRRPSPLLRLAPLLAALAASGATALVAGGEVTVQVRGDGVGGPASELMLAVLARSTASGVALGTDGIDGSSRIAGAKVTAVVRSRAAALGLDAEAALARNDAATFFERAGGAIVTGPTGTNTAELYLLLAER